MTQLSELLELFNRLKERISKADPARRSKAIEKATSALNASLKMLEPTQKELRIELRTHDTASKIRTLWNKAKSLVDVHELVKKGELTQKSPTIEHVIFVHYYPKNRLEDLAKRLEQVVANDPREIEVQHFQELRGKMRTLRSRDEVDNAVQRVVDREGPEFVRRFAAHLKTKDISGKRRLPSNASVNKLVEAVVMHLWKERMDSKAQEGKA